MTWNISECITYIIYMTPFFFTFICVLGTTWVKRYQRGHLL